VDAVYAKLLVVESLDAEGNVVHRERRRMAIAAMGAADVPGSLCSVQKKRLSPPTIRLQKWD
jgi:hypothetical protein